MTDKGTLALGELFLTAMLWGTSFPVISYAIAGGLDPRVFAFLRFAVATPLILVVVRVMGRSLIGTLRTRSVWLLGLLNAGGFLCQFIGQAYTGAALAALLINLSAPMAAVGSAIFLKERFSATKVFGVVLAVVGVVLLTTGGTASFTGGSELLGDALYLSSAVMWGAYLVYNKLETDRREWDPYAVSASVIVLSAVFVSPVMLTVSGGYGLSAGAWEAVLYTAVMNTVVPYILYQRGIRYVSGTVAALVLMLEVVTAVAISVAFLGEGFTVASGAGALAVLVSIFLVSGARRRGKSLSARAMDEAGVGRR